MVLEGCFPDQAKISSITPAYKKGERTLKTNYRPISILPAVSKLLEKFMFKQMSNYFEKLFQNICQDLEEDMAVSMFWWDWLRIGS